MAGRPCPRCGGTDRFFLVARPRNNGDPFWICGQCRHVEGATAGEAERSPLRTLTAAELQLAQQGYGAVADWCAQYLWTPTEDARAALAYLRARGFRDDTLIAARLGFHPDSPADTLGRVLFHRDHDAYRGAQLGGVLGPQGQPKWLLRGAITIPYYAGGVCTLLRTRKLDAAPGKKYLSPAGVALYGGGEPTLYNADVLADKEVKEVVITEGEFKALLAQQHGIPAVAQPGIGYFPDRWVHALARRSVVIAYDVEARKDPFTPSPGERFTLQLVERLTGARLKEELAKVRAALAEIKQEAKRTANPEEEVKLLERFDRESRAADDLAGKIDLLGTLHIRPRVLRLPRDPDQMKVDLDGYILQHGGEALATLITRAPAAEDWHARHAGGGYEYQKGGIFNGKQVANYQARIVETIYQSDGQQLTALQRLALRTPSGRTLTHDISDEDWADDRAARLALRVGLREGTFDDDNREVLKAIRLLSSQGDPPVERTVYTCTGWEQVRGKWHFLSSDGAVHADGLTTNVKAEIDPDATGNHYALCGPGDAAKGAEAWLRFLRGEVCPQPLALILAAQAALPLIHRFSGNTARTMVWLFHQSGALKTALTRASVMALYGPSFTAERADGAPVPKWDATSTGLGFLVFYYRDMPLLIDDYKQGVIHPEQFKRFLHNYSESTGRTRATKHQTIDRVKPARCIVFATAEDLPTASGDLGMEARLLAMQLHPNATNPDALSRLQAAGSAGHLAAFWRGFIQTLARELDQLGEPGMRGQIQRLIAADEERLPGHRRAAGALRQNRAAWLVLSAWLQRAGLINAAEAERLNAAHLEARALLAQVLTERQRDSKPSTIFLGVLRELLQAGDLRIEQPGMTCPKCEAALKATDDGWYCTGESSGGAPCPYHLANTKIVGFECDDGSIGLYSEKAFREVSRVRNDQRQPFAFSSAAIWQQLDADGLLLGKGKDGRFQVQKRNPARLDERGYGKPAKVLWLKASAVAAGDEESGKEELFSETRDPAIESMGSMGSWDHNPALAQQDAESAQRAHGIEWDQNGGAMGSEGEDEPPLIPFDPIRSHAWDQESGAPERAETDLDPIDPMKSITSPYTRPRVQLSPRKPQPVRLPPAAWEEAKNYWRIGNSFKVVELAKAHRVEYKDLAEALIALKDQGKL